MSNSSSDSAVYAAAQGREFLRNELAGKSNEYIRDFAGLVDDTETLDLLDYYSSLWADEPGDFIDTRMGKMILRSAATGMADKAFHEGNVSALQGMVGLSKQSGDAGDALSEIVDRLSNEGTIAVVTGPPGAGKTATTLDVTRTFGARTGGRIYGNTHWEGYDGLVESDVELLERMGSHPGQSLGVLDETMQALTGRGADSKKAEVFADRVSLIRKQEDEHGEHPKRGSLLLVSHVWGRMNKPTREMATLVIQKPSRDDPGRVVLYESQGGEDDREKIGEFTGLTDTRESYPEHEASGFDVVIPEDDDEDTEDPEDVSRRKDIETAIRRILDGATQPEAAEYTDFGRGWVGNRWREWKNGEHRDLVSAPTQIPEHIDESDVVTQGGQ